MFRKSCGSLFVLSLLGGALAWGQSTTGAILGTVRDSSNAVVAGAKVAVINAGTNLRYETQTNSAGEYTAPLLPIGRYQVEVSAPGFRNYRQEGIVLQINQQARVDVALVVGQVSETVEVTADAAVIE
ncbi:MAG: carboxypeptidase-like regulatory domain-containing protein, partial [Bryobacteraceae bacterium]|nr:carboxypeptidase-like regulatory domain-containing protein [Bryobacteraceae bacterium]